jgi:methylenetetrahydrofolate dehydrogenase (NADP+)/methenyltetrahydrofolate cyclohydrolase
VLARIARGGRAPGLATVLVGDDAASAVQLASTRRLAARAGIVDVHRVLPASATPDEVSAVLDALAEDDAVSGVLLQLPLPAGLRSAPLVDRIPPHKDVDGLTTVSAGLLARGEPGLRPCTPSGVLRLLDAGGVPLEGAHAVVVGRSAPVGRPMAQLLLDRDATVTVAHSRSRDLARITRQADVLVVAAGVPHLIGAEHVRPGAAVVDVGIHRTADGLIGDVRFAEAAEVAGWITPVPGGVGPMTIAVLLANTLAAAERSDARSRR